MQPPSRASPSRITRGSSLISRPDRAIAMQASYLEVLALFPAVLKSRLRATHAARLSCLALGVHDVLEQRATTEQPGGSHTRKLAALIWDRAIMEGCWWLPPQSPPCHTEPYTAPK